MFIELLFATTLDMSLPEFQPMEDISGNVIVSEMEDVSGDIIAAEIPLDEIPLEETSERSLQGLSLEAEPTEDDFNNDFLLQADGENNYITLSRKRNCKVTEENGQYFIRYYASYNYYIDYTLLSSGVTYDLDYNGNIYTGTSYADDSEIFLYNNNTITPSSDIYIMQYHQSGYYLNVSISTSGGDEPGGDVSGDDVSGDDVSGDSPGGDVSGGDNPSIEVDLSTVENKIDKLIVLGRSLLFVLIVQFCYPLIISIFNNIGGGRDV